MNDEGLISPSLSEQDHVGWNQKLLTYGLKRGDSNEKLLAGIDLIHGILNNPNLGMTDLGKQDLANTINHIQSILVDRQTP